MIKIVFYGCNTIFLQDLLRDFEEDEIPVMSMSTLTEDGVIEVRNEVNGRDSASFLIVIFTITELIFMPFCVFFPNFRGHSPTSETNGSFETVVVCKTVFLGLSSAYHGKLAKYQMLLLVMFFQQILELFSRTT